MNTVESIRLSGTTREVELGLEDCFAGTVR